MAKMFSINTDKIIKLENELHRVATRAVPFATKSTINEAAFLGMRISKIRVSKQFTTRNRWTVGSIQVEPTKTLNISRQVAILGSTEDYMEDQEFGAVKRKKSKEGIPIPTGYSSGEGKAPRPRRRLPRGKNKLKLIELGRRRRRPPGQPKHDKQELLFKVQDAVTTGDRVIFHDFRGGKKKGLFKVVGGRSGFKRGWPKGAKLEMLYDLSEIFVRIPRNPWLHPSVERTKAFIPDIYTRALKFQLRRQNLLQ